MIVYLQEELLSFDHFTIWDAQDNVLFTADREFFNFGKKVTLADAAGHTAAAVQHIPFSIPPAFRLSIGTHALTLSRRFALFARRYTLDELGWQVEGDFTGHDYEITQDGRRIAVLQKAWPAFRDRYTLEVAEPNDLLPAICAVIAIDCCDEQNN